MEMIELGEVSPPFIPSPPLGTQAARVLTSGMNSVHAVCSRERTRARLWPAPRIRTMRRRSIDLFEGLCVREVKLLTPVVCLFCFVFFIGTLHFRFAANGRRCNELKLVLADYTFISWTWKRIVLSWNGYQWLWDNSDCVLAADLVILGSWTFTPYLGFTRNVCSFSFIKLSVKYFACILLYKKTVT